MRAVALVNTQAGAGDRQARESVREALAQAGIDADVLAVSGPECRARAAEEVGRGTRLIIVAGGDGTVGAVAGALAGTPASLGILPMGSLNHLARDLGIPLDPDEAAAIIAAGHERRIDLAEVNGRAFVNNASIGLYPLMVVDREAQRQRLGRSKRLALLVASLRTMTRFHARRLKLAIDGGEERVDTPLLFVGNNAYRLAVPGAGRRESLDAGELCVMVMRSKSLPGFLAATARALVGLTGSDELVRVSGVRELEVDSHQSRLTLAIDGEIVSLKPPLTFRIQPRALRVLAPAG